jgi:GNAT superfamily N-acetyltransferase
VVTDYTTFAYLTDMYILPSHHGTGLGRRLIECIHETLESWPGCRRLMFISNQEGRKFYEKVLDGLGPFEQGKNGYMVMSRSYAGALGNLR